MVKAKEVKVGRERIELPDSFNDVFEQYLSGELTIGATVDLCGMSFGIFL